MKTISGKFLGTGAVINLGLGFLPDYVRVVNLESATLESIEFNRELADITAVAGGLKRSGSASVADSKLTSGNGVAVYSGGDTADASESYLEQQGKLASTHDLVDTESEGSAGDYNWYWKVPDGSPTVQGFTLAADSDVNVDGEVCFFEAGFFD